MLLMTIQPWKQKVMHWKRRAALPQAITWGIVLEQRHDLGGEGEAQDAHAQEKNRGAAEAEAESLQHTVVEPGAVIEAAHRLEPLAEADHGGGAEGHDPLYHAHSGDDASP